MNSLLKQEHINQFLEDGYCCIENVLSEEEINNARNAFHEELLKYDINHNNILNGIDKPPVDIRKKSNVSNMFYAKFKFDLQINERMYSTWKTLMNTVTKEYPLGYHDDVIPYFDRVCYRLPDHIREEGGLGLHLDRLPGPNGFKNIKFYRPIQGFLALTDHYGDESGGLKLVTKFHNEFDLFFKGKFDNNTETGQFFRMGGKSYEKLQRRCRAIVIHAGSFVMWDNRLPHSTCSKLTNFDSREVIYMSYIPNVPLNVSYNKQQMENFLHNKKPPAYIGSDNSTIDRNYDINKLTDIQKKILNIM